MKLSVVIVSYNVQYFLRQALQSAQAALSGIEGEILVVDNASTDGSVEMVRTHFPDVALIANSDNVGFATANNQAIRRAKGEFVLLLNPDTIVEEGTFRECLAFMESNSDVGALGVRMLDGKGRFLPESKRGFPTPLVSFFKIFGLSSLFPKSKTFGRYHLGYLSEFANTEVDVLSGAFMFMRRSTLDQSGLLDEHFFMYGEDIDLSWRLAQTGAKNYYLADSRIIHFKGESTKKHSLNYVRMFYQAMLIFARKHLHGPGAKLFILIIRLAIYLRATLALGRRLVRQLWLPVLDGLGIYGGLLVLQRQYASRVKEIPEYFPEEFVRYVLPVYALVWIASFWVTGAYDRRRHVIPVLRGVVLGTLLISALYGFLNEEWRFSRALILLGGAWAAMLAISLRWTIRLGSAGRSSWHHDQPRVAIVGGDKEAARVRQLLSQSGINKHIVGVISANGSTRSDCLGHRDDLAKLAMAYHLDELIYCLQDVPARDMIASMEELGPRLDYKMVPGGSESIIGSNSKNSAGELYAVDMNLAIAEPIHRRNKRLLDLAVVLVGLATLPLQLALMRSPGGWLMNTIEVLIGRKTWVGYSGVPASFRLPPLAKAVLTPQTLGAHDLPEGAYQRMDLLYARDYKVAADVVAIWRHWRQLGRR